MTFKKEKRRKNKDKKENINDNTKINEKVELDNQTESTKFSTHNSGKINHKNTKEVSPGINESQNVNEVDGKYKKDEFAEEYEENELLLRKAREEKNDIPKINDESKPP